MRFSPISEALPRGANFCIAVAIASWLFGCSPSSLTDGTASLVVGYWGNDVVVLVADGELPGNLPGWRFATLDREPQQKARDVRLTSPENARFAIGQWLAGEDASYAILPLSFSAGSSGTENCIYSRIFEDIAIVTQSRLKEVGSRYLVVIVPPADLQSVRSKLDAMGLSDDTRGYLDSIAQSMSSLSGALGSK